MQMIAAVDRNWAIGNRGQMLVTIPADQQFFRQETMGKVVVMGRKTLESFPGGQPLKKRTNIVLTSDRSYQAGEAVIVHSMEELMEELEKYPREDIFVIGGESIYRSLLPWCRKAYVTRTDHAYDADTWFPDLDADPEWRMTKTSDEQTYFDLEYYFTVYERIAGGK